MDADKAQMLSFGLEDANDPLTQFSDENLPKMTATANESLMNDGHDNPFSDKGTASSEKYDGSVCGGEPSSGDGDRGTGDDKDYILSPVLVDEADKGEKEEVVVSIKVTAEAEELDRP